MVDNHRNTGTAGIGIYSTATRVAGISALAFASGVLVANLSVAGAPMADATAAEAESWYLENRWRMILANSMVAITFPAILAFGAARDNDNFLVAFSRERNPSYEPHGEIHYYEVNRKGEITSEKILKQEDIRYLIGNYAGRPAPFIIPLPEKPLLEISGNGRLYSAFSNEFLIHVYEENGTYSHAYYNPVQRHILDANEVFHPRFSHNDQLLRVWESAVYPENWPVLYSLLTDDENRIWISTITENRDELKWWIIDDRTGIVTATFLWPFNKPIYSVKNESVYTVEKNGSGFKEVVKYRILE